MPPRAIFHLDGEPGLRGGQRQLLYLAAALRARGRRGVIYARARGELAVEAARLDLEVRSVPFLGEWDPVSAALLARAALKENAVLHAHTSHAAGVAVLASCAGVPFVAHRRVDFPVARLSARWKYGRAARVVCVSQAIAEIMRKAGGEPDRLAVVPDGLPNGQEESAWAGVDPGRFRPPPAAQRRECRAALSRELGIDEQAPWIGNLAALVPHKDHDTLLAAALIVILKRPSARFLIAGRGPEESRLFESIRRMGLLGKVLLLGHRPDPIPLLKALDVYAQSSWGEGMGSVLLEAAACGVPIAATTAGGIPEVVDNEVSALLVVPRNPEALAEALIRLIDDRALAAGLAQAGLRRIDRFGLKRMADQMESVYDQA
ncbi:MAG: glycosyltransferase [Elusimicrobia bacterium]|nr:glycosyltransferase [Elusimicrobiota bacterium]